MDRTLRAFVLLCALCTLYACVSNPSALPDASAVHGSDTGLGPSPVPEPPRPVSLSLSPEGATLSPGESVQYAAKVLWSDGSTTDVTSLGEFATSDPSVVTVTASGRATGVRAGQAVVTATGYGYSASVAVTVTEATARTLSVSPDAATLSVGAAQKLTVLAAMSDGSTRDVTSVAGYKASDGSVLEVGLSGVLTARAPGSASVTVTYGLASAVVGVRVSAAALSRVVVSPEAATLTIGESRTFSATGSFDDGTSRDISTECAWTVSPSSLAEIDARGSLRALAAGTVTVTATCAGQVGSATATMAAPRVVSLTVSPANSSVVKADELQFTATATYSTGHTATVTGSATWSTDDSSVGVIDSAGKFTAVKVGATEVRASFGGQTNYTSITVVAPSIVSLSLSPAMASIVAGSSVSLSAIARLDNGTTRVVTDECQWTTSEPSAASVLRGVVTGLSAGSATITCSIQGRSTYASVTVTGGVALSLTPSHDFGTVYLGYTATATLTVTNSGSGSATLGAISTAGLSLSAPFKLVGGTCATGDALAAGASCTLRVQVATTTVGAYAATLSLSPVGGTAVTSALSAVGGHAPLSIGGRGVFTCHIGVSGMKCWGLNSFGQLGLGNTANRGDGPNEMGANLPIVNLGTGRTAKSVRAGNNFACAILDNGTVKCWGRSNFGQLGNGSASTRGDGANEMGDNLAIANLGTGRTAKSIALGDTHACAILDDDTVKCWGQSNSGQLGLGDTSNRGDGANEMGDNLPVVDLGPGRTAKRLALGDSHTCAVLDDGSVKCWGWNPYGQLGLGDTITRGDNANEMGSFLPTVDLGPGRTAKTVTAGLVHTCALLDDDTVKCWGSNDNGRLGLGDTITRGDNANEMGSFLPAVDLGPGRTARAVIAAYEHTCALLDDDTVKCWGRNASGQLGLGDTTSRGGTANSMGSFLPVVDVGN